MSTHLQGVRALLQLAALIIALPSIIVTTNTAAFGTGFSPPLAAQASASAGAWSAEASAVVDGTSSRATTSPAPLDGLAPAGATSFPVRASIAEASHRAPTMRFVYFVETDMSADPEAVPLIEHQARALQAFWYQQFGGTFRLDDPVVTVVHGQHRTRWYDRHPNGPSRRWYRLNNMRAEVRRALGIQPDEVARMVTYPAGRIDGRVGANQYAGAWMDGDDIACIDGSTQTVPYSADYPAHCLATVIHELGHVYGLGHQGGDEDCMQLGFYSYLTQGELCRFSPANVAQVQADPFNAGWLVPLEEATASVAP